MKNAEELLEKHKDMLENKMDVSHYEYIKLIASNLPTLEDIEKKYKSLNRKVNELNRKLKAMG